VIRRKCHMIDAVPIPEKANKVMERLGNVFGLPRRCLSKKIVEYAVTLPNLKEIIERSINATNRLKCPGRAQIARARSGHLPANRGHCSTSAWNEFGRFHAPPHSRFGENLILTPSLSTKHHDRPERISDQGDNRSLRRDRRRGGGGGSGRQDRGRDGRCGRGRGQVDRAPYRHADGPDGGEGII